MLKKIDLIFQRYEFLIPLFLFLLFLAVSLPGVSWGAPALWNPDELIWRVDQALGGYMQFDVTEPDFNYPSLPKQVMYLIGSVTYGMGRSGVAFIVAARSFSGILGALVGVLVYLIAHAIGANKHISALAGLLYIVGGVAAANARFAHNDLYLQLFSVLCLYFLIRYQYSQKQGWLYASFLMVGMAASAQRVLHPGHQAFAPRLQLTHPRSSEKNCEPGYHLGAAAWFLCCCVLRRPATRCGASISRSCRSRHRGKSRSPV